MNVCKYKIFSLLFNIMHIEFIDCYSLISLLLTRRLDTHFILNVILAELQDIHVVLLRCQKTSVIYTATIVSGMNKTNFN